jgi:hypothetical protein
MNSKYEYQILRLQVINARPKGVKLSEVNQLLFYILILTTMYLII